MGGFGTILKIFLFIMVAIVVYFLLQIIFGMVMSYWSEIVIWVSGAIGVNFLVVRWQLEKKRKTKASVNALMVKESDLISQTCQDELIIGAELITTIASKIPDAQLNETTIPTLNRALYLWFLQAVIVIVLQISVIMEPTPITTVRWYVAELDRWIVFTVNQDLLVWSEGIAFLLPMTLGFLILQYLHLLNLQLTRNQQRWMGSIAGLFWIYLFIGIQLYFIYGQLILHLDQLDLSILETESIRANFQFYTEYLGPSFIFGGLSGLILVLVWCDLKLIGPFTQSLDFTSLFLRVFAAGCCGAELALIIVNLPYRIIFGVLVGALTIAETRYQRKHPHAVTYFFLHTLQIMLVGYCGYVILTIGGMVA